MSKLLFTYGMVGGGIGSMIGESHRTGCALDGRSGIAAGCFSRDAEKNAAAGKACGLNASRVYGGYREMAKAEAVRADGIDFVIVVTPNVSHYEIAREFLLNGINVVSDKPLCITVAEALELESLSREKNLLFGVTYTYTGHDVVKLARELVRGGNLGRIIHVEARYAQDWLAGAVDGSLDTSKIWRLDPQYAGVSCTVADIGTHVENMISYITGLKIKRLSAVTERYGELNLDLAANILVEYDSGAYGAYWCTQAAAGHSNDLSFTIIGTEGSIEWGQENADTLKVAYRGQPPQTIHCEIPEAYVKAAEVLNLPAGHNGVSSAFANIYAAYIDALQARKSGASAEGYDFPTVTDGVSGMKFLHAAIESASRDAAWVTL
ncbi:MAG: Gfo/Idh/MocA family oxidoreductase [Oscillospiraceae bacterium]|jgi:predicted dehydrogenase|nr:Gfo/Idh/MocA family oxidoreductase [Oscillospiraceae bacterium]